MQRGARVTVALAMPWLGIGAGSASNGFPSIMYEPGMDPQAFVPVSYRCPPQKNGTVEIVKMNTIGARTRFRVIFEGDAATYASIQRAWPNKPLEAWYEFSDPRKKPDDDNQRSMLEVILGDSEAVRTAICFGPAAIKEKYDKILEHNRLHLKPPAD